MAVAGLKGGHVFYAIVSRPAGDPFLMNYIRTCIYDEAGNPTGIRYRAPATLPESPSATAVTGLC